MESGRFTEVTTIDIAPILNNNFNLTAEGIEVVNKIADACLNCGFFQIVGHSVDKKLISDFNDVKAEFFTKIPREEKSKIKRSADNSRGWFDDELTKQTKDWKEVSFYVEIA